jgi:hypothetical protein
MTPSADILEKSILEKPMQVNLADELGVHVSSATVIRRDEPMAKHTTLRVGGPADVYIEPATEADLAVSLKFCRERQVKFLSLAGARIYSCATAVFAAW